MRFIVCVCVSKREGNSIAELIWPKGEKDLRESAAAGVCQK